MPNICLLGDTHFRSQAPEGRLDTDFLSTQLNKLEQVYRVAEEHDCIAILQTGDFFDRYDPTVTTRQRIAHFLYCNRKIPLFTIAGQHDMVGHSVKSIEKSEIKYLEKCGLLNVLGQGKIDNLNLFGASFGQGIPQIINPDDYNILVIHKMIGNRKLYPQQKLDNPIRFLKKHNGFKLIVCGDYHYRFIEQMNNRTICNPGVLVRLKRNIHDLEHKPGVIIFDTDINEYEFVLLDVEPVDDIFNMKEKVEKDDDKYLVDFLNKLQNTGKIATSFDENLQLFYEEHNVSDSIKNKISMVQEQLVEIKK